ncbi:MAG: elongation factor P [Deltaproteobacteria bacterium]|jgi:elongation factor P|nr:elongation factor P [Deltaproteobacteria bacterium]
MIVATKLRIGMMIIHDGDLCRVLKTDHVTPGKGKAHMAATLRNVKTGNSFPCRWNSDEKIERAFLEEHEMQYLYDDGEVYHLMNTENFEQIAMDHEMFGDAIKFILPNQNVKVTFHDEKPVGIELPQTVVLEVVEAEGTLKKQTATGSYKKCKVETGLEVMVPPFVKVGDSIRISTESGDYQERA